MGKTALVSEVHKPLVRDRGHYISGKFNQFSGDTPYYAFVQVFFFLFYCFIINVNDCGVGFQTITFTNVGRK